jgi:hypothetical protein
MRSIPAHRRAALRAIGPGALLAISIGLSGCYTGGEAPPPEDFCGIFYACGNHGGSDDNDPPDPPPPGNSGGGTGTSPTGTSSTPAN